jgi:hypothetical protein
VRCDRDPKRIMRSIRSVMAKNVKCEVEHYTVHKHFYGNGYAKFLKMLIGKAKSSGFYIIVSFTLRRTSCMRNLPMLKIPTQLTKTVCSIK